MLRHTVRAHSRGLHAHDALKSSESDPTLAIGTVTRQRPLTRRSVSLHLHAEKQLRNSPQLREVAGRRVVWDGPRAAAAVSCGADVLRQPAPGAERAAGRRVERARHVALEHDPLLLAASDRRPGWPTAAPACTACAGRRTAPRPCASSTSLPRYITPDAVADVLDHARGRAR